MGAAIIGMRRKGTGSIQQSRGRYAAYAPQQKGQPRRLLGLLDTRREAERALNARRVA